MKYKPIRDKLIIKKDSVDSSDSYETKSGIIVINSENTRHKGRLSLGTIVAMGSTYIGKDNNVCPMSQIFSVGDKVLYYHPAEIPLEDDLVIVRSIDIDLIVEGDNISLR